MKNFPSLLRKTVADSLFQSLYVLYWKVFFVKVDFSFTELLFIYCSDLIFNTLIVGEYFSTCDAPIFTHLYTKLIKWTIFIKNDRRYKCIRLLWNYLNGYREIWSAFYFSRYLTLIWAFTKIWSIGISRASK